MSGYLPRQQAPAVQQVLLLPQQEALWPLAVDEWWVGVPALAAMTSDEAAMAAQMSFFMLLV